MVQDIQLRVDPATAATPALLAVRCMKETGLDPLRLNAHRVVRRSIDARQRRVMINLTVRLWLDEIPETLSVIRPEKYPILPDDAPEAIVVGAGPGGAVRCPAPYPGGCAPHCSGTGQDSGGTCRRYGQDSA